MTTLRCPACGWPLNPAADWAKGRYKMPCCATPLTHEQILDLAHQLVVVRIGR